MGMYLGRAINQNFNIPWKYYYALWGMYSLQTAHPQVQKNYLEKNTY